MSERTAITLLLVGAVCYIAVGWAYKVLLQGFDEEIQSSPETIAKRNMR